ncbi:hypothetical protein ACK3C2_01600 [Mycoplasmoides gallisepticum]|uniref:hypothetical protein n=1 Tax=Mycoplasmoides gallisepticum TaxID=2096 RepID=UPI003917821A
MGKKSDNKRYKADVEYQARKFIIDHGNNDILYLPYCVIASGVNRHHKHIRQIYNDFDALPNDVQKEVLKQAGYDYQLIESSDWINEGIKEINDFAKKYDFGDTFLYDGAKHFHRAFSHYSSALASNYNESEYLFEDKLGWYSPNSIMKKYLQTNKLDFSLYLESYYRAFVLNDKSFNKSDAIKPLDYLNLIKNFGDCYNEELCFWMTEIISKLSVLVLRTRHGGYLNDICIKGEISIEDTLTETFEDKYYEALMHLYTLQLDRKQNKVKSKPKQESN